MSFLLYVVAGGQEAYVSTLASTQMMPPGHTVLFLLEDDAQIQKLFCNKLFFAVCKGGDGPFEFIAGIPENTEQSTNRKD